MSDREDSTRPVPGAGGTVVGIHGDQPQLDLQGGGVPILSRFDFLDLWTPHLRPAEVITLTAILKSAGGKRGCFKFNETLAKERGVSVSTIERGLRGLKARGILPARKRGKATRYEVDYSRYPDAPNRDPVAVRPDPLNLPRVKVETDRARPCPGVSQPSTGEGSQPSTGEGWHRERLERDGAGSAAAVPCTATAEAEPAPPPIGNSESGAARVPVTRGSGHGHARGPHEPAEREKQKPEDPEPAEPTANQFAAMLADWSDHDLLRFREGARGATDRERELASYDAELSRRGLQDQAEAIAARADAERAEAAARAETAAAAKADAEAMTAAELEGALQSSQAVLSDLGAEAESWIDSDAWEAGARRIRAEQVRHEALSEALRRRLEHQRGKPVDRAESMAAVQALDPGSLPRLSADVVPLDRKEPPPPAAKPVQLTLDLDLPAPDAESDSEAAS